MGGWGREFVCSVGRFPYRVGEEREPQPQTGNKNLYAPLSLNLKLNYCMNFGCNQLQKYMLLLLSLINLLYFGTKFIKEMLNPCLDGAKKDFVGLIHPSFFLLLIFIFVLLQFYLQSSDVSYGHFKGSFG
jgi:hypothetical protein